MENIRLGLRIIGYGGLLLFVVQVINLWLELFKTSQTLIYWTLGVGMGSLFILVLVDRLTNDEDRHYSKTVEK
tara:strand:+ start:388 stop:606 length:219 start_codon:yes stop_codon:yes gene_type:complete